jgi:hypothetical protein
MASDEPVDPFITDPQGYRSLLQGVNAKPERMVIMDLTSEESLLVQFNPTELDEALQVDWAKIAPPGLSHKRLHYVGTDNVNFNFSLLVDAAVEGGSLEQAAYTRQFLQSLCYAKRGARTVREGQAPRALLIWPELITLNAVIAELHFKYERFHLSGAPMRYTVQIKLEEIRDVRLYGEDVLAGGSKRNASTPAKKQAFVGNFSDSNDTKKGFG